MNGDAVYLAVLAMSTLVREEHVRLSGRAVIPFRRELRMHQDLLKVLVFELRALQISGASPAAIRDLMLFADDLGMSFHELSRAIDQSVTVHLGKRAALAPLRYFLRLTGTVDIGLTNVGDALQAEM